jgi:hypothetical protein
VNFRLDLPAAKDGNEQARDEGENPQEYVNQPAKEQPVDQAMMLVLRDGNGLNADVGASALRAGTPRAGLLLLLRTVPLLIHGNTPFYLYALSARK